MCGMHHVIGMHTWASDGLHRADGRAKFHAHERVVPGLRQGEMETT